MTLIVGELYRLNNAGVTNSPAKLLYTVFAHDYEVMKNYYNNNGNYDQYPFKQNSIALYLGSETFTNKRKVKFSGAVHVEVFLLGDVKLVFDIEDAENFSLIRLDESNDV